MSLTPIFDATLADAPADIFLASSLVFPNPAPRIDGFGNTILPETSCAQLSSWYFMPSFFEPTNLSFLGSVA